MSISSIHKKNILALILGLVVGLALGETILRLTRMYETFYEENMGESYSPFAEELTDKYTWYFSCPPNSYNKNDTEEFQYNVKTNSLGLTEREIPKTKPENEIRIFTFGDSFTEGVGGLPDSTWPKLLQQFLNQGKEQQNVYEVYTCGKANSDPFYNFIILRDKLISYNPDIVFFAINGTDLWDAYSRGGMERFQSDGTVRFRDPPWYEPLYQASHLVRMVVHDFLNKDAEFFTPKQKKEAEQQGLKILEGLLPQLKQYCEDHNIKLVIVLHPCLANEAYSDMNRVNALVPEIKRLNIDYIDIRPCFVAAGMNNDNWTEFYWEIDHHNTPKGYGIFAKCVYDNLDKILTP